jgi:hypothetical protein
MADFLMPRLYRQSGPLLRDYQSSSSSVAASNSPERQGQASPTRRRAVRASLRRPGMLLRTSQTSLRLTGNRGRET